MGRIERSYLQDVQKTLDELDRAGALECEAFANVKNPLVVLDAYGARGWEPVYQRSWGRSIRFIMRRSVVPPGPFPPLLTEDERRGRSTTTVRQPESYFRPPPPPPPSPPTGHLPPPPPPAPIGGGLPVPATSGMPTTKTCPRCAEDVKFAAQVCRYCGHEFVGPR